MLCIQNWRTVLKFSGVGVFKHCYQNPNQITKFEERIVMTDAASKEEAERLILAEFEEYATEGVKFLRVYEVEEMYPEENPVIEIANSMKVFDGTDEEYIEKYWDDQKPLSCETVGWHHVWFNRGGGKSGCYNCQEERDGELYKNA